MKNPIAKTVEEALAEKLRTLRTANGWTYEVMAQRMAEHGVTIHPSAVQKTEKSGRGVTLSELSAYSRIYGIPIGNLLDEDLTVLDDQRSRDADEIQSLAKLLSETLRRL
jgi:transcriptional regulator with XRE-family HTH domain